MIRREARHVRPAVTLIEILIVVAIISVLVSLTVAGVARILGKGAEMQAQNEILRMSDGLATFRQEFGVEYIPSRLKIRERHDQNTLNSMDALERASLNYLSRMFGSRFNPAGPHDWTGRWGGAQNVPPMGQGTPPVGTPIELQGQECLVFFLGGIPTPDRAAMTGFSTSPSSPTTAGGNRRGPFFEFKSNRLIPSQEDTPNGRVFYGTSGGLMLVYIDPFSNEQKRPYLFFSSAKAGYSQWGGRYDCEVPTASGTRQYLLPNGPYFQAAGANNVPLRYHNHDGFQIISAGPDELYGQGGLLRAGQGALDQETGDNKTNFSRTSLAADGWQ